VRAVAGRGLAGMLAAAASVTAAAEPATRPAPPSLAVRALDACAGEVPSLDVAGTLRKLDTLTRDAEARLRGAAGAAERVGRLNRFLFLERGFTADPDLDDRENLCLDRVLARRRGYCTGLATLYLAVAQRLGMAVHAVPAPGHLFLRYDDGRTRINIETQEAGREISDATYRARYRINEEAAARGVYLANLTDDRFLSQVLNNLGAVHSHDGDPSGAERLLRRAIELDPLNVTTLFNLGTERMREGDLRGAGDRFSETLALDPGHVRALNNRGVCRLRLGEADGAVADFLAALALDPEFTEARRNLETVGRAEPGGR